MSEEKINEAAVAAVLAFQHEGLSVEELEVIAGKIAALLKEHFNGAV